MSEKKNEQTAQPVEERTSLSGAAGFAIMRLARAAGVFEMYKQAAKEAHAGKKQDAEDLGIDMMFAIMERLAGCEQEFWEAAAKIEGISIEQAQALPFDAVRGRVITELLDPDMISFFSKTQATSGK